MSLSGTTWEQGGYPDIVNENSPCINPNHYYYKGGLSLSLVDYYTVLNAEAVSGLIISQVEPEAGSEGITTAPDSRLGSVTEMAARTGLLWQNRPSMS